MMGFTSLFVQMTNETIYKDKLERIYRLYLKASNKDEILNSKPINLSMHIQQINKEQGGGVYSHHIKNSLFCEFLIKF